MRKPLAVLGAVLCCAAAGGLADAAPASAVGSAPAVLGDPMDGNLGFGTVVEQDALLGSTETEGTVALGGDLTFGPGYHVMIHPTGTYRAPGESRPTALFVGGRILMSQSASNGVLRIENNGYVHVQDASGLQALDSGAKGAAGATGVVESGAVGGSASRVQLTTREAPARLSLPASPIDFASLFTAYRMRAQEIAACPDDVPLTNAAGVPLPAQTGFPAGTRAYITLTPGRTNVLHLSGQDAGNLAALSFRTRPSAGTPLVVVVDPAAGAYSWHVPNLAGVSGTEAPYMLWDFPSATDVTLAAGGSLEGTIYAPNAHLTVLDPSNIEGDIAVKSLWAGPPQSAGRYVDAGEIRDFPFDAELACVPGPTSPSGSQPASSASAAVTSSAGGGNPAPSPWTSTPGLAGGGRGDNGGGGHHLAQTGIGHGRLTTLGLAATAALCGGGAALVFSTTRRRRRSARTWQAPSGL